MRRKVKTGFVRYRADEGDFAYATDLDGLTCRVTIAPL